jgi:hypothetical protein
MCMGVMSRHQTLTLDTLGRNSARGFLSTVRCDDGLTDPLGDVPPRARNEPSGRDQRPWLAAPTGSEPIFLASGR